MSETNIANDIKKMLESKQWNVMNTHGNMYQKGLPDKYCTHKIYGQRWVEVKKPKGYCFTNAQLYFFPLIDLAGVGIWVLSDASEEQYKLLLGKSNWKKFLRKKDLEKIKEYHSWFSL